LRAQHIYAQFKFVIAPIAIEDVAGLPLPGKVIPGADQAY